ncbi:host-nuclease inhibitor Gam family protein [Mammaliicoccus sciuri]|uniref:host-nuclease inhibitor Gam family protein n=1 Tax=Mammaliicoccus sciuri TaxID=1296 RepID=UPI001C4F3200|nr:host-nuclease inhibitor Gam family protein [Mammaliicoccus sciuri]
MANPLIEKELEDIEVKESFKVHDLDSANWALKKIAAINSKQTEVSKVAENEIEKIKLWEETELNRYEGSKEYLQSLLVEYYKAEKEKDPKFKLSTPYGKVTSRKGTQKWEIPNKTMFINTLKERGFNNLVRIKEEINLADLKKQFHVTEDGRVIDTNGEIIEGTYVIDNPTSYSVKAGE